MRHYTEKMRPATMYKSLEKTTCDLCGEEACSGEWDTSVYEVNETDIEVTIKQKEGYEFPEGGSGTTYQVDMCPECFKDKLIPWLEAQGCKAVRKDWGY